MTNEQRFLLPLAINKALQQSVPQWGKEEPPLTAFMLVLCLLKRLAGSTLQKSKTFSKKLHGVDSCLPRGMHLATQKNLPLNIVYWFHQWFYAHHVWFLQWSSSLESDSNWKELADRKRKITTLGKRDLLHLRGFAFELWSFRVAFFATAKGKVWKEKLM